MKVELKLPQMGESISEGTLLKWFKKPGDKVEKDEILYEISTDKVDTEIPSPVAGILSEILIGEDETVAIGTVLGYIETEVEQAKITLEPEKLQEVVISPVERKPPEPVAESPAPPILRKEPVPSAVPEHDIGEQEHVVPRRVPQEPAGDSKRRFYSPLVLRIAQEEGISLAALEVLTGSGIGGRVAKKDILAHLEELKKSPAAAPHETAGLPVAATAPDTGLPITGVPSVVPPAPAVVRDKPQIDFGVDGTSVVPMNNMHLRIAEHMVRSMQTSPHVTSVSEADVTGMVTYRERENQPFKSREGFSLNYTAFVTRALVLSLKDFPELNASIEGTNIIYKNHINVGIAVALESGLIVPVIKHAEEKTLVGLARSIYDLSTRAREKKLLPDEVQDSTISLTNFGSFGSVFGTPIINQPNVAILGMGAIKKRPEVIGEGIAIRDMMYFSLTYDHRLIDGATGGMFLTEIVRYLEHIDSLL